MAGARQGDLFGVRGGDPALAGGAPPPPPLPLLRHQLLDWQNRLGAFQRPLFPTGLRGGRGALQASLFPSAAPPGGGPAAGGGGAESAAHLDPLALAPQSLQFWRWPEPPQHGPALYLVMDRPAQLDHPLLLYVGETGCADRRWKGEHDCKGYLAAYGEALRRAGLEAGCSIRFWADVPAAVRPRRALEQALIRLWQPPFNKETRQRWATPFTSDPG